MKVLFVEDEPALRESVALFLEIQDYNIRTAVDGQYAWEMISTFQPDLIITDIKMPRMSGIELLAKVRNSTYSDLPIIITSAYSHNDWVDEAKTLGITSYIIKPFSFVDLNDAIQQVADMI